MQFIDLRAQYLSAKDQIDSAVQRVLAHGSYIMGPEVEEFEELLANYVGVKNVISCGNGTDAIQLSLMAQEIGPGDVVFCPTFTFFATMEAISLVGATPIFVDSEPSGFNICPQNLASKIHEVKQGKLGKPKAILAVDLFGLPANYVALSKLAEENELTLIEDAAQGMGGSIVKRKAGSFGDIATTSFFPAKPLGCYGDGGAVLTNDDDIANKVRSLRVHGKGENKYDNIRIGLNSRLDTLQAAILIQKIRLFPSEVERRNVVASKYLDGISSNALGLPKLPSGFGSSWAQYTLLAESFEHRAGIMQKLKNEGIPTAVYYAKCGHQQTAYERNASVDASFPNAECYSERAFSIPMHPFLEDEMITKIISVLNKY